MFLCSSLKSYGKKDRDPGYRCISVAQYALIRIDEYDEKLVEEHGARWYEIAQLPLLILDHNEMVHDALLQLKQNARYKPIGFEFCQKNLLFHNYKAYMKLFTSGILTPEISERRFCH